MKWVYRFFIVLGVIFFILLVALALFVIVDPYNLRPLLMGVYTSSQTDNEVMVPISENEDVVTPQTLATTSSPTSPTSKKPLTETQIKAIEAVGLDPQTVPTTFTDEQKNCFISVLGGDRVNAILAGDTPTPVEFYQAKNCL